MSRHVTPPALKGDNAVLVDREMQRLRHRQEKGIKRKWRIITGTSMLFVLGLSTYVLTQYILAYLSLSPSTWFLSDSVDGTHSSPDPLLRTLALIGICASGFSTLCALSSGFYLRFSRRRSCGTCSVWLAAILSTTVSLLLCILNLTLIAMWHKKYASAPDDPFAVTRDVSRRCNGVWDLDLLWSAATSSPIAKVSSDNAPSCTHNGDQTLQAYLIAGGVRLVLFVLFCSIWLACLGRYNRTLQVVASSNESVMESAEMHKLLMEEDEGTLPSMPTLMDATAMPGRYSPEYQEGTYSNATLVAPPPRLDRFRWQRTEPSFQGDDGHTYGNVAHRHDKDPSAGAWSMGVVGQVWNALWAHDGQRQEDGITKGEYGEHSDTHAHERQASRLGVRGWFRRDASGQVSDEYAMVGERDDGFDEPDYRDSRNNRFLAPPPLHGRTPSQEKRATEGRHAAARIALDREGDGGLEPRSKSRSASREREERRKREQQDRIDFLASLGFEGQQQQMPAGAGQTIQPEDVNRHSSRRSSVSAGDELPHMPELTHAQGPEEDEGTFWRSSDMEADESRDVVHAQGASNLYVRTLGRLVHKLSAIESVGSKERAERVSRSGRSASDLY